MTKNDTKGIIDIIIRICIWFFVYGVLVLLIYFQIENRFGVSMEEQEMVNSINKYYMNIKLQLLVTVAFSITWWLIALMHKTQYFFERNTVLIALVFIVLLGVIDTIVCIPNRIVRDSVEEYKLNYGFAFWPTFCFNLFCIPPKAVQTVLMGNSLRRWLLATIMILLVMFIVLLR